MSFKDKIDNIMETAVRSALEEATLKISHFTGKVADKKGFTMTKVGDSNPGAVVVLKGDEKAIIGYARKYLGAEEGESLSQIQSDQSGGNDVAEDTADSDAEVDSDIQGKICQCCDNKIGEDGCGCNEDCKHCGGMGKPIEDKSEHQTEAKKLDPVGKADADIDNDGDVDSSDEYLKNRRKKIGSKIDATKLKEMAKAAAAK